MSEYTPTTEEREALAKVIRENRSWTARMSDGYLSTGSNTDEEIADAVLAAGWHRTEQGDAEVRAQALVVTDEMLQRLREAVFAQSQMYYPSIEAAETILRAALEAAFRENGSSDS